MDKSKYGRLITFEGIEGCGKSTLAKELYEYLKSKNYKVIFTREPGGGKLGEKIREILLSNEFEIPDYSELFLFLASRYEHTKNVIIPRLKEGYIVISDRYMDSTIAYQGYGRKIDLKLLEKLNEIATLGIKPDLTFLIDLPEEISFNRLKDKILDRIESEEIEFYKRVRFGYIEIARNEPLRFIILDGTMELQTLKQKVFEIAENLIRR
ncbi:MAG: dTMP kinase [Candidatus Hydrothermia bacterium]|nr:dTMP kinase [Candidatus Hydrothermia bacterium]